MAPGDRERLRGTFTEDAELYDRARPGYPPAAIDDLAELAGLRSACRALEIGCGTGRLTMSLAERGCRVTAVELGAEMAEVARRKLTAFASATVVTGGFEEWTPPAEPFDAVVSASAFHWLDPAVRVPKVAGALRAGGALATITNHAACVLRRGGGLLSAPRDIGDAGARPARRCHDAGVPRRATAIRAVHPADRSPI
jgi:protein-L-isoaspartate O-methyltransferase